jgi:hypothetical protein
MIFKLTSQSHNSGVSLSLSVSDKVNLYLRSFFFSTFGLESHTLLNCDKVKGKSVHGLMDLGAGLIVQWSMAANHAVVAQPTFLKTVLISHKNLMALRPGGKCTSHKL